MLALVGVAYAGRGKPKNTGSASVRTRIYEIARSLLIRANDPYLNDISNSEMLAHRYDTSYKTDTETDQKRYRHKYAENLIYRQESEEL